MKNALYLSILIVLLLISCNNSKNKISYTVQSNIKKTDSIHPGKTLMETYCYVCHNPTTTEENRLAPPMIAIKKHYISNTTTKAKFISNLQNWIANPNPEDAKMYGAVKRFGVMQKISYPKESIQQIADYIYDNQIEEPVWFKDHYKQRGKNRK